MRPETEARIRRVQKFGKNGRQFCALAAFFMGIFSLGAWAKIFFGPRFAGTTIELGTWFRVDTEQLVTASSKIWSFVVVTVVLSLLAWTLLHLYRLFKQLEAGSIYTKQNVYHLRQIGWLSMALAATQLLVAPVSFALARMNVLDDTLVAWVAPGNGAPILIGQSFSGAITASLILLASWIMEVGREISDDAEAMRHEADLVI